MGAPQGGETVVLAEIARAISRADDASDAVQKTAESLQRHFGTWSLGIWLDGQEEGRIRLTGLALSEPHPPELASAIFEAYGSVAVDAELPGPAAMRARAPVRFSRGDVSSDPQLPALLDALDATALLAVPILMDEEPVGCAVMTQAEGDELTPESEALLTHALGLIAIVFHRVRLLERDRERSLRLRTLARAVEHLPLGVKIVSPDGVIQWANAAVRDIFGYDPEALVGRRLEELRADPDPEVVRREIDQAVRAGSWMGEVVDRHRDGHTVTVHATLVPVLEEDGGIVAMVELERDLTAERAQHTRMQDAYRLAAVGELAAGVAHEVNNPLQAIASTAELLLLDPLPETVRSDVAAIRLEAKRGGTIVRNLLAYARPRPPTKARVDLKEVVESVVALRGPQIRVANIALRVEAEPGTPPVDADADQIKQVLHNLIGNATQAVRAAYDSGAIVLRVRPAGEEVELTVEDSGPGIPTDVRPKIFRPFFTTKAVGEGTGLGLSVSLKLVRENGGDLEADNWGRPAVEGGGPGEGGARFVVRFPASREAAPEVAEPPSEPAPARTRVLVVDDEPTVAGAAARYLARVGYHAEVAGTGEEALERLGRGERYEAVLVDLKMPGMGGEGLYEVVRQRFPDVLERLIFTSGDIVTPATHSFLEKTGRPVLAKPYELAHLAATVEQLAGRSA